MTRNTVALTRLLMRERPSLLRLAERILGSRPAAEDVTQSLWLKLQRIEDDPPILRRRAYLYRLASNLAIDVARAEQRRDTAHEEAMSILDNGVDGLYGERVALARDELARVKRAIDALPETTREVFLLSRLENMPQRAIAAQLGISRPTVEKHLRKALDAATLAVESDA